MIRLHQPDRALQAAARAEADLVAVRRPHAGHPALGRDRPRRDHHAGEVAVEHLEVHAVLGHDVRGEDLFQRLEILVAHRAQRGRVRAPLFHTVRQSPLTGAKGWPKAARRASTILRNQPAAARSSPMRYNGCPESRYLRSKGVSGVAASKPSQATRARARGRARRRISRCRPSSCCVAFQHATEAGNPREHRVRAPAPAEVADLGPGVGIEEVVARGAARPRRAGARSPPGRRARRPCSSATAPRDRALRRARRSADWSTPITQWSGNWRAIWMVLWPTPQPASRISGAPRPQPASARRARHGCSRCRACGRDARGACARARRAPQDALLGALRDAGVGVAHRAGLIGRDSSAGARGRRRWRVVARGMPWRRSSRSCAQGGRRRTASCSRPAAGSCAAACPATA